jgi:hypothetical protein
MAQSIAKAIALPGKSRPIRFPSFPSLERTAVMAFNSAAGVAVSATTTANTGQNQGGIKAIVMRSPTFPTWFQVPYSSTLSVNAPAIVTSLGFNASFANVGAAVQGAYADVVQTPISMNNGITYTGQPGTTIQCGNGVPLPYCNYVPVGVDSGCPGPEFLFCPAGSYILSGIKTQNAGNWSAWMNMEQWTSPGSVQVLNQLTITAVGTSSAVGVLNVIQDGWYRCSSISVAETAAVFNQQFFVSVACFQLGVLGLAPVFTVAANTLAVTVNTAASVTVVPQPYLTPIASSSEFSNSTLPWCSTRLTAVAALFTNTTKVLNKEGSVLWGRVTPGTINPWSCAYADVNRLHPSEKAFMGLEDGCYTYVPPSTDLADFLDYIASNVNLTTMLHRLDNMALVNVGFFTDPDGGTNLSINTDWHIEFRSSSTLFEIGTSNSTLESLHHAQIALLKAGFFYPNFSHVAIMNAIIGGLASISNFARTVAPFGRALLESSSIASRQTKQVQPTSAAGSGMTKKKATVNPNTLAWVNTQNARRAPSAVPSMRSSKSKASSRTRANSVRSRRGRRQP